MRLFQLKTAFPLILAAAMLSGCYYPMKKAKEEDFTKDPGIEFAPQMYHSIPYEPMTQLEDRRSVYDNTIPFNKTNANARKPVEGTIKRNYLSDGDATNPYVIPENPKRILPFHIDSSEYAKADSMLENPVNVTYSGDEMKPVESDKAVFEEGKALYTRFCEHCHGSEGKGKGKVADKYLGVPTSFSSVIKNKGDGHVFWVITQGKNAMPSHASQLTVEERWKITNYVQYLKATE